MYNFCMKKILIRFTILLLCFYIFQSTCLSAQTQPVKYSSTAIQVYNAGIAFHKQGKYELAEQKYNQALKIQPNLTEAKNNIAIVDQKLAIKYYNQNDYNKAILYGKKALHFMPDRVEILHVIAHSYADMKDAKNAYEYYKKILSINPNDIQAQNNFQIVKYYYTEGTLNSQLNNIKVEHNAPNSLYDLIKPSIGVSDETVESMKNILDMIWSEPNGQMLLQALIDNKIPINLTQEDRIPCIKKTYANGITSAKCTIEVIIPVKTISGFIDKNSTTYLRVYNLRTFVHEFGHAFISLKNPNDGVGSLEEELGVDMIGYNVSLKVITGQSLDKGQTQIYSFDSLKNLLSDNHRNLPVYSGFNKAMQGYGIVMPYPEIYSNIPLMYKKLLSEGKVAPTPTFNTYLK